MLLCQEQRKISVVPLCSVSGHDFSHADKVDKKKGFSPCKNVWMPHGFGPGTCLPQAEIRLMRAGVEQRGDGDDGDGDVRQRTQNSQTPSEAGQ